MLRAGSTESTPFEVILVDGDFSPQLEFEGFTTELAGKWLDKTLFEAIITPFVNDLKSHLGNSELYISSLYVNDRELPLRCKKRQGFRMPAREFAAAAQTPGQALQPVVVRIGMWDNRLASSQLDQAGHLFRICLGAVSAEAMVGKRTMGRSLARGVLVHFLQKHNKQDGVPQYTLADITAISIGAMNDETADEEVTSVEGEVRDGIGEVQRTLRSPASKIALPGGTILVLTCCEPTVDKRRLLGYGSSSPGTLGSGDRRGIAQRMRVAITTHAGDTNVAKEVSVSSLLLDLDDDDAEVHDIGPQDMTDWLMSPISPDATGDRYAERLARARAGSIRGPRNSGSGIYP